jgi:hypothetical protein
MIGSSLGVNDPLVDTDCSSDDIRTLAWIHKGALSILLICKVDQPRTVHLQGITGKARIFKIDNTIPWEKASIQTGVIDVTKPLIMNGYTVLLLNMW